MSAAELAALEGILLLDVRSGAAGAQAYREGHLKGALHVDLDRDLAAPVTDPKHGGRHPLPDVATFCATLGRLGVSPDSDVVLYDDKGGSNAAARLWWMLRALGHGKVRVLDGGIAAAKAAGLPVTAEPAIPAPVAPYPATRFDAPVASHRDVDMARQDPTRCVLDVRAAERFAGVHEPLDPVAGHIPGAVNLPLSENLDADGRFKSADELRAQYSALLAGRDPTRLIVHCGSGVTACHTLLALDRAGMDGAALYVGSWSEWCRNEWPIGKG
ncbi:MAG TPA: sulfurtransferase [Haliangium sp.]|nr:sulfurtransferase [Haliangium sp.]